MSVTTPPDPVLAERLERAERELAILKGRMTAIQEIGAALGSTLNLDRLLSLIMAKTTELMEADRSTLYLIDEDGRDLWAKIAQGGVEKEIRFPIGEGVAGWVAKTGQTLNIKDAYKDARFNQEWDVRTGFRTRSMLCQPMRNHRRKIIGVMQVLNKRDGYFTVDDEQLLSALSNQAAISLENSKLYLSVVGKNIELLDTQEKLRQRVAEMDLLFRIEEQMNREQQLDAFLPRLVRESCTAIPSTGGALFLCAPGGWEVYTCRAAAGLTDGRKLTLGDDEIGRPMEIADSEEPFISNDIPAAERNADPVLSRLVGGPVRSTVIVPLTIGGATLGALQLVNRRGGPQARYGNDDLKLLTVIAGRAEAAVVLGRQRDEESKASRLAAIGQAVSGVLHDLRTPMTVISGYTQLMVDEEEEEERGAYAEAVTRQLGAIKGMTTEILSFARGESTLLIRKTFVHQFVSGLSEVLQPEMARAGVEMVLDLGYRDAMRMDIRKMERVIFNLARNARQAMVLKGGSRFLIRTGYDEETNSVDFWFEDNGPGIPEEIRHNVFESFVTSGKADGTGLGLAIVKKFVEQHGGTIGFDSETGRGTTFHIRLPRNIPKGK